MKDLQGITQANDDATAREYNMAVRDGNLSLAARIASANPDLFPVVNLTREPRQRVQTQREGSTCADCSRSLTVSQTVASAPVDIVRDGGRVLVCWHCAVESK